MRILFEGIEEYWKSNSNLTDYFTGGIHLAEAPNEAENEPYVVVNTNQVHDPQSWNEANLEERYSHVVVFVVVDDSKTTVSDGADLIKEEIPIEGFDVEGYDMKHFKWVDISRLDNVDNKWNCTLEYNCILEEE